MISLAVLIIKFDHAKALPCKIGYFIVVLELLGILVILPLSSFKIANQLQPAYSWS